MADIKLPFGLKDDILVHISQVERGLACGCVCPQCNKPLVARKGSEVAHHFAHRAGPECANATETALHLAAKGILADRREIRLPPVEIRFDSSPFVMSLWPERTFALGDVRAECRTGDIIPDILAYCDTTPLMIEIRVTHPVDEAKLKKIWELRISTIEIDLSSALRTFSLDDLCDAILKQTANKRWLFNAESEEWKQVLLRTGEKKETITRGFAKHVDHCPLNVQNWKGKPYANFIDDCSGCEFLLSVGGNNDFIICGGRYKIRTFDELRAFRAE
jgi:hypothetical protein